MPTTRYLHGIKALSYTYKETQAMRLGDLDWFPGLERPRMGYPRTYEPNRIDSRWGAAPQTGGVQHIAVTAEFLEQNSPDQSAENVTAWGLHKGNNAASWNDCTDRDSWVPLLPTWTRPWQHGSASAPRDLNSLLVGQEMGIMGTDWTRKPDWFVEAHLKMAAAVWAMYVAALDWPLEVVLNQAELYRRVSAGRPVGFTEHWVIDNANRNDAGQVGTALATTFPWHKRHWGGPGMLPMIQAALAVRAGAIPAPAPAPSEAVKKIQALLNDLGSNLDVDGHDGPLTTAAAQAYAGDYAYPGKTTDHTALLAHLEDTMTTLADLAKTVAALPRDIWRAPITLHPLTRQALGTTDTTKPASYVIDTALRRAIGAWRKAHTAVNLGRANAERIRGLETAVQELAANIPGVDTEAVTAAIQEAVGRYELALTRVEDDEEEQA